MQVEKNQSFFNSVHSAENFTSLHLFNPEQNSTKSYKWENWKEDFTIFDKISNFQISNLRIKISRFFWNTTIIWQIPTSEIDQNQFLSLHVKVYCRSKAFFVLSKLQLQGLLQMNLCILSCIDSTMCSKIFWSGLNFCNLFPF